MTNAFKYAYPGGSGEVACVITTPAPDRLRLEVRDRGIGLPSDKGDDRRENLGMRLISALSRQLGGEPEWHDMRPGTGFALEFPRAEKGTPDA